MEQSDAQIYDTAARHRDGGLSGVSAFLGQPGVGKTFEALRRLEHASRSIFFDTVDNIGYGPRQNPMPDYVDVWGLAAFIAYMPAVIGGDFRVVFHPGKGEIEVRGKRVSRREYEFECVCRFCAEIRRVVLCIDEVWHFTEPGWMPTALADITLAGRPREVIVLYTAQIPQMVSRRLTAVTTTFAAFRIQEPLDVAALRGRLAPEALALLPTLPDRSYIARDEQNNWKLIRG